MKQTELVSVGFQLAALEFPPKKLFGNRDERMVAERRNHLEAGCLSFIPHNDKKS